MDTISIVSGDHEEIDLEFYDESTGAAIDITGSTIFFTVKEKLTDADAAAVFQKVVSSHTSPTVGQSKVILTHDDTILPVINKLYYCDLQMTDANGYPHTPLVQRFMTTPEVTGTVI